MIAKTNSQGRISESFEVQHAFEVNNVYVSIQVRLNISQWTDTTFQVWGEKKIFTVARPSVSKIVYSEEYKTVEFDTVEEATAYYSKRILNTISTIRAEKVEVEESGELVNAN